MKNGSILKKINARLYIVFDNVRVLMGVNPRAGRLPPKAAMPPDEGFTLKLPTSGAAAGPCLKKA